MPIVQQGQINTTALLIPDAYIIIVPPAALNLNGVPSNIAGIVGSAPWGPVNSPVVVGNIKQYQAIFGAVQNRKYDGGTMLAVAAMEGANNFVVVRVTDGTDTLATATVLTNCLFLSSEYTGSGGNGTTVTISAGSQVGSYRAVVSAPGLVAETFDNIGNGLTGNALWIAIAAAISNGTSTYQGPSKIVNASAGIGTNAPVLGASYVLAGGTDGVTALTPSAQGYSATAAASILLGQDATPRSGMYALRAKGCAVAALADCDLSTSWSTQVAFGQTEGIYMIGTTPAGDTIANAVAVKAAAGIDNPWFKLQFGDWISWLDTYNNIQRFVSPQGPVLGKLVAMAPNQSTLNKQMNSPVGTQSSAAKQVYASADLQQLGGAGIDLLMNPCPGGAYFGNRFGKNSSSDPLRNGDNYTRMTNYIASTLNAGMGIFIGRTQAADAIGVAGTASSDALATLKGYFSNLQGQGLIGSINGPAAASTEIDADNNPPAQVALGYLQADCSVQFQSIIQYFLINVQGGQSVAIPTTTVQAAA